MKYPTQRKRQFRKTALADQRQGVATVELAVCLPVIVLLIFGSIQACDLIYLRHGVTTAAYEGSLEASRIDATTATVKARIDQVLVFRGVKDGTSSIQASANEIANLAGGEPMTITVSAPVGRNMMLSGFFLLPSTITVDFVCTR